MLLTVKLNEIYFEIVNRYSINQHISEIYRRPKKLLNAFKNIYIWPKYIGRKCIYINIFFQYIFLAIFLAYFEIHLISNEPMRGTPAPCHYWTLSQQLLLGFLAGVFQLDQSQRIQCSLATLLLFGITSVSIALLWFVTGLPITQGFQTSFYLHTLSLSKPNRGGDGKYMTENLTSVLTSSRPWKKPCSIVLNSSHQRVGLCCSMCVLRVFLCHVWEQR